MEPIRMSTFEHAGRRYRLREAVPFSIEFAEGVWAYSNDTLGIRVDGKNTGIRTKISHGEKVIPDGLLAQMAKQTKLVKKEFLELTSAKTGRRGTVAIAELHPVK